jgi:porin-like protein
VLRGYAEIQFDSGSGFDNTGNSAYINLAYVQWAGITAGKAPSFFAFFGGGEAWANIFSPDQQGFNQPDVLAYTATFGGGFSATIAIQDPSLNASGGGSNNDGALVNATRFGMTAPDFVANVRVDQSWGSAQISGALHQVHVFENSVAPGLLVGVGTAPTQDIWGYAFGGGVSFNLPSFGAGDKLAIQADYSKNATLYSGLPDGMWDGTPNDNGLAPNFGDTYFAAASPTVFGFATPTAWSVGATFEHHFSPQFSIDPEFSYGELHWANNQGQLPSNTNMFIVGAAAHWDPVPQLDFEFELLYENIHQDTPANWLAPPPGGFVNGVFKVPYPANNADGVAGRFEVTRSF